MKRLIDKVEYPKICELYRSGMTHENIGKIYSVDRFVIGNVLRRCEIKGVYGKSRIYTIDETLFEKIDCEWKAWFLGWAYSDGNISQNGYEFSINLNEKDKCILDAFNQLIYDGKKPLEYRPERKSKLGSYTKPSYRFRIINKKICSDLINLGVVPAKSLIIKWPQSGIPGNLIRHFIRGLFEGDGSVYINRSIWKYSLYFLGTFDLMNNLQKYLESVSISASLKQRSKIFQLLVTKKEDIKKLLTLLYEDSIYFLPRKSKDVLN